MYQDLQNIFNFSLSISQILFNTSVALLCGLLISVFYKWTYRGPNYSSTFVNSLIILSMITAVVIMVIGNNLARAFGLVGAMSIIRFRTAVKDTQDIVFLFFALAVGLAAGVGLHSLALIGTLFISTVIWVLYQLDYANPRKKDFLLQFMLQSEDEEAVPYLTVFKDYCKSYKLINVKSYEDGQILELSFYINLKDKGKTDSFVKALDELGEISQVNLFFDELQF
jgi:uncharacterized membrane protein YhiD involved in acid resistance